MVGKPKKGLKGWLKKYHKWISIICTLFILLFAFSGIVMNHRESFGSVDVNRQYLPESYQYANWNLAAIKGGLKVDSMQVAIFGNIGVWLTDTNLAGFKDLNQGFPQGIDNRKISSLAMNPQGDLFAGTLFGLYRKTKNAATWEPLKLPANEKRVVKVLQLDSKLLVMTRSALFQSNDQGLSFQQISLPPIQGKSATTSLFRLTWIIHSGELLGLPGKLVVDMVGIVFILLSLTGLVFFISPTVIKRLGASAKKKWTRFFAFSLRWHNRMGTWLFVFLLITTVTGMFLRPPLLISIAGIQLKATESKPNLVWDDKLRDIIYDAALEHYIIATADGLFYVDNQFKSELKPFALQPPISVMGITVFEKVANGHYLIGSFSGLFDWFPERGLVIDRMTGLPADESLANGPPIGNVSVSGYYEKSKGSFIVFDYGKGALQSYKGLIAPMPNHIKSQSPMSLWNLCLEIHTARIWEPLIGGFYILIVPLSGVFILFILVSGLWLWILKRKRKN